MLPFPLTVECIMDQTGIINLALGHISQPPITNISDGSVQADAANLQWVPCLQEVLRGNNWSFASATEALVAASNFTPIGWAYAYAIPAASMACWRVFDTNMKDLKGTYDFRIIYDKVNSVNVIVTNYGPVTANVGPYVEYTYYLDATKAALYDSAFVNMLSFRLAAALAMPLNADPDMAVNMTKIFQNQMSEAQRQSSYENQVQNGEDPECLINARMGGGSGQRSVSIGGTTFDIYNRGG